MKKAFTYTIGLIVSMIVLTQLAYACSVPGWRVVEIENRSTGDLEVIYSVRPDVIPEELYALGRALNMNSGNIERIYAVEVERFLNDDSNILPPYRELRFFEYNEEKEQELLNQRRNLLNCEIVEVKKEGKLLITHDKGRSYCTYVPASGTCPYLTLSYPQFIGFLLTNFSSETILFQIVIIAVAISIAMFLIYLRRRKEIRLFFGIGLWRIILLLVIALPTIGISFLLFFSVGNSIFILVVLYLVINTLNYIRVRMIRRA